MSHAITDDILRSIISGLGDEYDSHDVIFGITRNYPKEYTIDLYACVSSSDPILALHQQLGRRLLGLDDVHEPTGRPKTRNTRGQETENQKWRRKKN